MRRGVRPDQAGRFHTMMSAEALRKHRRAQNRQDRRDFLDAQRQVVADKSDSDVIDLMVKVIMERAIACGNVMMEDFQREFVAPERAKNLFPAALELAKQRAPEISGVVVTA
ncbi:MAG TPA: hypothetical protein VHW02_07715 [Rhizomicrobium sp.]|jgi:hypothetical protein|nr:hypothetical protein [Rhizomicrobium sp.]